MTKSYFDAKQFSHVQTKPRSDAEQFSHAKTKSFSDAELFNNAHGPMNVACTDEVRKS